MEITIKILENNPDYGRPETANLSLDNQMGDDTEIGIHMESTWYLVDADDLLKALTALMPKERHNDT